MTNKWQHRNWISGIPLPGASPALALALAIAIVTIQSAGAQNFTLLYGFTGKSDGGAPRGGLVRDSAGNLYGTTYVGGLRDCFGSRCGVVFKVDQTGKETVLHRFKGTDGSLPTGALVSDKLGNLYGTASGGGAHNSGTVFKLNKSGKLTVLYTFSGGSDGAFPLGSLLRDETGNLYGTTTAGGVGNCFMNKGCGIVFKLDKTSKETVLYAFTGGADGATPLDGGLIRDHAGNLYGTTRFGGVGNCGGQGSGCGVVFKLDKSGKETVLYAFTGGADGGEPLGGLTRDRAGNLYGSAVLPGFGAVFTLDKTGKETVLYTFTDGTDGGFPNGGLIRDAAGNIYGTTTDAGSGDCHGLGCGVIFKLDRTGTETVLYNFTGDSNGFQPYAGLIRDKAGNFYGTTQFSGDGGNGFGTVFRLAP